MDNLIEDIIKFRENLNDRQKYLERTQNMRKPNDEMLASSAETVTDVLKQLDLLIAKHVVNNMLKPQDRNYNIQPVPWLTGACNYEVKRRFSLNAWLIV